MADRGPLSRAAVWRRHRAYYEKGGMTPWTSKTVPSHPPNSAYMAAAYVRMVARYLLACRALPADHRLALAADQPVHVVELGAGTGRLGLLFLELLDEWRKTAGLELPPIRYVLTDISAATLFAWRRNPRLKAWFDAGVLDRARYDALRDEAIDLELSKVRLDATTLGGPVIVLANYLFDSLPHDVVRVRGGAIEVGLVDGDYQGKDRGDGFLAIECDFEPAAAPYGDAVLDGLLADYAGQLGDVTVMVPIGGVETVRRLDRLSGGRMLLLTCDKGPVDRASLDEGDPPTLAIHGDSVSAAVNFDLLAGVTGALGGYSLATRERSSQLQVVGLGLGAAAPPPGVALAFAEAFDGVSPIDVYQVYRDALPVVTNLGQCLALLRLANDDPWVLMALAPRLRELIEGAHTEELARLRRSLRHALRLHLPQSQGPDLFFEAGHLLAAMRRTGEAEPLFRASLEHHGPNAVTLFNLAVCRAEHGALPEALQLLDTSLALDPGFTPARELRLRLAAELSGP